LFLTERPQYSHPDFAIIDQGRNATERAITVIQDGDYYGHGYIDVDTPLMDIEDILEQIPQSPSSDEINSLIGQYLNGSSTSYRIVKW